MIQPPVVVCDMCQQREAYPERAKVGSWQFPEGWRRIFYGLENYHICPAEACLKLFRKQSEEMPVR